MRTILHVDMDAFYASIEIRDQPALRGRPVIVGGPPASRGVVCSASYEARAFGVRSAMASSRAHRLCPEAIFISPDFARYGEASARIQALFHELTPLVEPLSLDEAYLDLSAAVEAGGDARRLAADLRQRIHAVTGLTASAGVAANKFLAKAASDACKPDGLLVLTAEAVPAFLATLPASAIPGVGAVTAERCTRLGIRRAVDFLRLPHAELAAAFGSAAAWFLACARGEDERPVQPHHERRSVGIEDTFAHDLLDRGELLARLAGLAQGLEGRLAGCGALARTITLKVKYHDFTLRSRSRTVADPVGSAADIARIAGGLAEDTALGRIPVRLLGLSGSHLDGSGAVQQVLDFATA
jgi:DNA polymerase-4